MSRNYEIHLIERAKLFNDITPAFTPYDPKQTIRKNKSVIVIWQLRDRERFTDLHLHQNKTNILTAPGGEMYLIERLLRKMINYQVFDFVQFMPAIVYCQETILRPIVEFRIVRGYQRYKAPKSLKALYEQNAFSVNDAAMQIIESISAHGFYPCQENAELNQLLIQSESDYVFSGGFCALPENQAELLNEAAHRPYKEGDTRMMVIARKLKEWHDQFITIGALDKFEVTE